MFILLFVIWAVCVTLLKVPEKYPSVLPHMMFSMTFFKERAKPFAMDRHSDIHRQMVRVTRQQSVGTDADSDIARQGTTEDPK